MKTEFKKITYNGQKAEITKMHTDLYGRTWVNLYYYNRDNGSITKVENELINSSAIKFI
jgi:hypothetical protein